MLRNIVIVLSLFTAPILTHAEVTNKDIAASIDTSALTHPYLFFSEKDKPALIERIKNDPECGDIMSRLIAEANRLLYTPVDRNIPVQGKNTNADWSEADRNGKYETYYISSINNAFSLAFVYQMTGEDRYARKAFEFADVVCDIPTWTMRAHEFPIIYERIMPWNVPDDQACFSFDHTNGETGRKMAMVYDWLYPALNRAGRDRIRGALLEKVITKVRGNYEYHWWATAYRCNWCGVCNAGLGMAALALLTEDPRLTDVVAESYYRIDRMYSELGVDGGWQEGGDYWVYGTMTSMYFADALKRVTHGKYNLFENERLRTNPVTFPLFISVPHERGYLNFEDSRFNNIFNRRTCHMIKKLVNETGSGIGAWFFNTYYTDGDTIYDILWPRPEINPVPPPEKSIHFRTIDWWVMRNDFDNPESVVVAGKAGKNDDPHHGHLDCGHVALYWRNQAFIRDLGSAYYDEYYFRNQRWDYPQASSAGHNVIFVNGETQLPGKTKNMPLNPDIGGTVLEFRTSPEKDYVIMDPANAYPGRELKGWRRHVILEKPLATIVLDEITADRGSEIEARFHSECTVACHDAFAMLTGDTGSMALIPVTGDADFHFRTGKHACQPINALRDYFEIPYFGAVVTAEHDKTILATIIVPVRDENEANDIADSALLKQNASGNMTLSYMWNGREHRSVFTVKSDGLVLE